MNTKVLPQSNSLISGSNLWVLPQPQMSRWCTQMDWYMGGLITNAEERKPHSISNPLNKILTDEEIPVPIIKLNKNAPLLISSESFLPNKKTVIVEYDGSVKDWTNAIVEIWTQLQTPTLRVFLPSTVSSSHFLDQLPKMKFKDSEHTLHLTIIDDKPERK